MLIPIQLMYIALCIAGAALIGYVAWAFDVFGGDK